MKTIAESIHSIPEESWRAKMDGHFQKAREFTKKSRARRGCGEKHPMEDFLFDYYPYPVALLETWHPELEQRLAFTDRESIPPHLQGTFYHTSDHELWLSHSNLTQKQSDRLRWIIGLLEATAGHPPVFGCHGLHEWAMVYKGEEIRHRQIAPLRLPQEEVDAVINSRPLICTHHDAFRFFAKKAQPLNRLQPSLETRHQNEQPGCVHVNMDLYKWAAKSMPWSGSALLLDCFALARELRDLDMRASPYDLSDWNLTPVKIETPEGRTEYELIQKTLAARAKILRRRLIERLKVVA